MSGKRLDPRSDINSRRRVNHSARTRNAQKNIPRGTAGRGTAVRGTGNIVRKKPAKKKAKKQKSKFVLWLKAGFEAAIIVIVLFFFLWPIRTDGLAMSPTISPGDRLMISRLPAIFGFISAGDIVICTFRLENDETKSAVMRVIAVPQDIVTVSGGRVSVNGHVLYEYYLPAGAATFPDTFMVLGRNEFFVLGDNRPFGGDSRTYGPVSGRDITARVLLRVFPFYNGIRRF